MHREHQDQQQPDPEIRQRDADLGETHDPDIRRPPLPHRGRHAQRHGQHGGERHRHHRQRKGDRHALQNEIRHRDVIGGAASEITAQQPPIQRR